MAIGRTARGTAAGASTDGSGAFLLMAAVPVGTAGSTLVLSFYHATGLAAPDGMTWNGVALTKKVSRVGGGNTLEVWVLENATSATGTVVIDDTTSGGYAGWTMTATEITGAAVASFDKSASANSSGTTPSSGATATTAQANEMLLGFVARANAVIDGSWSNSFNSGQTVTRSLMSIAEGHLIVSATGAYTAAKTGVTTSVWSAAILTFKEDASGGPTSATIGMSVTATAPRVGTGRNLIEMGVTATLGLLERASRWVYPPADIAAPLTTLDPQQVRTTASIGVRTNGAPYIAAWTDSPTATWRISSGGEMSMLIVAALYAPPVQLASPTEPHWLVSFHEIGGAELYAIGVTPDLRLCGWTRHRGVIMSAPGVVSTDGTFHQYEFAMLAGRTLSIDGVAVAHDLIYPADFGNDGMFSEGHLPCRLMVFNGIAGTTRCECAILGLQCSTENNSFVWQFAEGVGSSISGGECLGDLGSSTPTEPDIPGVDWTLRFGWYDPRPQYALPYGPPPTDNPATAYRWLLQTQYKRATVIRPNYRRASAGPSTGYRVDEGAQST